MTAILNKKVLLSAGAIAFVAAMALSATYAAWQAQDEITGNTVSTAQLAITAAGVAGGSGVTEPKPIDWEGALPGDSSSPEERAEVTNDSDVALDLWMYYENTEEATCEATKVAWQSSVAGTGPVLDGYPSGPLPTAVGDISDDSGYFKGVQNNTGVGDAFQIATAADFEPGDKIAVREIAGFADDADYPDHAGTCQWKEVFVGTLPGEEPEV